MWCLNLARFIKMYGNTLKNLLIYHQYFYFKWNIDELFNNIVQIFDYFIQDSKTENIIYKKKDTSNSLCLQRTTS